MSFNCFFFLGGFFFFKVELDSVARNFESTNVARIMFLLVSSNHCVLTVKANIVLVQDPRSLECLTSGPQGMGRWCYFSQHTEQPSPEGQPPLRPCTGSQLLGQSPETLPPPSFLTLPGLTHLHRSRNTQYHPSLQQA